VEELLEHLMEPLHQRHKQTLVVAEVDLDIQILADGQMEVLVVPVSSSSAT
jgi:hypothetical protein